VRSRARVATLGRLVLSRQARSAEAGAVADAVVEAVGDALDARSGAVDRVGEGALAGFDARDFGDAAAEYAATRERAGLIPRGPEAQWRAARLQAHPLKGVAEWTGRYRRFWEGNFQRLDALLDELKTQEKKRGTPNASGDY